jgi:hypothetical protein
MGTARFDVVRWSIELRLSGPRKDTDKSVVRAQIEGRSIPIW